MSSRRRVLPKTRSCIKDILSDDTVDPVSYVGLLKACAKENNLSLGIKIHGDINKTRLLNKNNDFIGSALINMYAHCGALDKAQEVFDEFSVCNIFLWTALISGYAKGGHGEQALKYFRLMQQKGLYPNPVTYVCILKACGSIRATEKGQEIHSQIVQQGFLDSDNGIGAALINMYVKCDALTEAQDVFGKLPIQDLVSWNALILGYIRHGFYEKVLQSFDNMLVKDVTPNAVTFVSVLQACGSIRTTYKYHEIHSEIVRADLLSRDTYICTALVDMYVKCGELAKAQEVFAEPNVRNGVSCCNALITGYVHHFYGKEAIQCFAKMQDEALFPDAVTYICIIKACNINIACSKGQELHTRIIAQEPLQKNETIGNALVDMYVNCDRLAKAQEVCNKLDIWATATWNTIISGYVHRSHHELALNTFQQMLQEGLAPNEITFCCVLKSCGNLGKLNKGQQLHSTTLKTKLFEDVVFCTALIDMYCTCGLLVKARELFDELSVQDVVSWTALITGYTQHGYGEEALKCYKKMCDDGIYPNVVTYSSILKACSDMQASNKGFEIHAEICRRGLLETDYILGTTLIDMYAKCGALEKASEVFLGISDRNVVSWTALIGGYIQHGYNDEALKCFEQMQQEGISPNAVTYTCILKSCGNIGVAEKCEEIHSQIVKEGVFGNNIEVNLALIDAYAKCGVLSKAQEVFDSLPIHDVISWNMLIAGYMQLGKDDVVFKSFNELIREGKEPDVVTLTTLLNTCSHCGLSDTGEMLLYLASTTHGTIPTLEHFTCLLDLLGRSGQVTKALAIIEIMPFHYTITMWHTLLSACQRYGNFAVGQTAFKHATELLKEDCFAYVCMSNICAIDDIQYYADVIG